MDLILWRHAEAQDANGADDLERRLTPKGRNQAERMGKWLLERMPAKFALFSSPALRARQTAEALGVPVKIEARLAPGAEVSDFLALAGAAKGDETVVIVGHQPDLGRAVAQLLFGSEEEMSVRKGALWWLKRADEGVKVRAVMSPELL